MTFCQIFVHFLVKKGIFGYYFRLFRTISTQRNEIGQNYLQKAAAAGPFRTIPTQF